MNCPKHPGWGKDTCVWCNNIKKDIVTVIPDIQPFVTDNITGKPIEVTSRRHKRNLMKRHDVVEFSTGMDKRE